MVITINDNVINNKVLISSEIQSKVKNIKALFDLIKQEFSNESYKIEKIDENSLLLTSRKFLRRSTISIEDYVESNLINIQLTSETLLLPENMRNWLNKRFLRLKNSVWIILLLVMAILVPIIVIGYIYERLLMLRVFGIVLVSCAGLFYILFMVLNPITSKRRLKQKTQAIELVDRFKQIITNYSKKELSGTICWNCFSEVSLNQNKCPKCGVSLEK